MKLKKSPTCVRPKKVTTTVVNVSQTGKFSIKNVESKMTNRINSQWYSRRYIRILKLPALIELSCLLTKSINGLPVDTTTTSSVVKQVFKRISQLDQSNQKLQLGIVNRTIVQENRRLYGISDEAIKAYDSIFDHCSNQ